MSRTTVGVGEASRIFPGLCLVNSGQWRSGELVLQLRSVVREVSRRQMIVNLIEKHHADYSGRLTVSTRGYYVRDAVTSGRRGFGWLALLCFALCESERSAT